MGSQMAPFGRHRFHTGGDRGFAVPTVLFAILAVFSVASVAAVVSVGAQRGTVRDANTKAALAAAEAGVNHALLRYNRVVTSPGTCVVPSSAGTLSLAPPPGGVWCAPVTGQTGGGTFKYWVSPSAGHLDIVALGTSNGVSRRILVGADSVSGQGIFSTFTVKSKDQITLDSNAQIRANAATNGGMTLASNARLCGTGAVGIGQALTLVSNAQHNADTTCTGTGTVMNKPLALPAVNQGDAATVNDNARFFAQDLRTGGNRVNWVPATRTMSLSQNSSLTLGGSVYSFCKLTLSSNTVLYVAPGSRATIFFDSPEACGLPANTVQLKLSSNARITATGGGPANVALLFVGSDTLPTRIELNSNTQVAGACEQNFVIYAPRTNVKFDSNSTYCGAIGAKSVHMDSNSKLFIDSGARNFVLPNSPPHFEPSSFVDCSATEQSPPDKGC
jgi:type II secretory pathway pseudopilin PulG